MSRPDPDSEYYDDYMDEKRFVCCGGRETHRFNCEYYGEDDDTDALGVSEPEEDEDADEWPGEDD